MDPIAGLDAPFSLPEDLRDYLADYGISYLVQAQKKDDLSQSLNGWYSAVDLDLGVIGPISGRPLSKDSPMVVLS